MTEAPFGKAIMEAQGTAITGKVLNVDDDPIGRYTITHVLEQSGFEVIEAASGAETLRLAQDHPDLILLDVNMPDIDGFEVCRRLKADPATSLIPVLHLSATSISSNAQVAGLEGGADGYLTQPVDPPVLVANIRAFLRLSRAEEALRNAGLQWQASFDALRDGVCLLDATGRVQRCNRALIEILGRDQEEILGLGGEDLVAGLAKEAEGGLLSALRTKARATAELSLGDRYFAATVDPVVDQDGAIAGGVLVLSDISERKAVEKMREEHLALVSHDLRSPLTAILGHADLVRRALQRLGLPRETGSIETVITSAKRMSTMIQELVDSARLESGEAGIELSPFDLRPLVTQLIERLGTEADRARLQLEARVPVLPTLGDAEKIERAVANLVGNALKYSPPEAPVTVELDRDGDRALVIVSDRGVGIPAEDLPHLFQRYYRSRTGSEEEGLGLGLYITRLIAEAHGGQVSVESEVGQGSTFRLALPFHPQPNP